VPLVSLTGDWFAYSFSYSCAYIFRSAFLEFQHWGASTRFLTQQLASDSFVKILLNPGKVFILHLLHFVAVFVFESFLVNRKLLKSY
jgi:hypothetical protein